MGIIDITAGDLKAIYQKMTGGLKQVRKWHPSPLALTEKILYSHLINPSQKHQRGQGFLQLQPDRVAMQDVTAQMALLQFMLVGKDTSAVPATVHCDHLIQAWQGAGADTRKALTDHHEVFQFLSSMASRYQLGFWKPGAGIIHQVILENYAFPGGVLIGTDSHTPNAGGLGMVAVGVGGADAADAMAGMPWEVKNPGIVGVHLKGRLKGWSSPKDVILKLLGILTVKGGTNKVIEYFGEGCETLSSTGKATITNMGAELGATCSLFPYDKNMEIYLQKTQRDSYAQVIAPYKKLLAADSEVLADPHAHYDEVIEIDLSSLEPHLAGPHSPDAVSPLSEVRERCQREGWPARLSAALIGSCTNSSYEDIGRACHVAGQALKGGIKMPQYFLVTPGSELIRKTIERDGYIQTLEGVGALVLANACGPCIGQWRRDQYKKGQVNTIINSFNRNFRGRNDANPDTLSFIASPEITMALGLSGRLDFNPETDYLENQKGEKLHLSPPVADVLPAKGFPVDKTGYVPPSKKPVSVVIDPGSSRLKELKPFDPWDGKDLKDLLVLCKAQGKCTTDHISPAGFWLRYRGHLDKISDNLLSGAVNAFTEERGRGQNLLTGKLQTFAEIARHYKSSAVGWVIVGEENYGEGSSREHAAMTPRFLGARAVLAKSFARIHETNLKKQGVLPLVFEDPSSWNLIQQKDRLHILGLKDLKPGSRHLVRASHEDGTKDEFFVTHSLHRVQIKWFKAGSAVNFIRQSG